MFEDLIVKIIENIKIILLIITFICFLTPICLILIGKNSKKDKKIINIKDIWMETSPFKVFSIAPLLLFFVLGLLVIFLVLTKNNVLFNKVLGSIFGSSVSLISVFIAANILKEFISIIRGKYVIVIDELNDKEYYHSNSYSGFSGWDLYFKDYFEKYNKYVWIRNINTGKKYNIGDKFYLVFINGKKNPFIYPVKNELTLSENDKSKLMTFNEAKDYINLKEYAEDNNKKQEQIIVNYDRIKKDFQKAGHKRTAIVEVIICAALLSFLFVSIKYFNSIPATIIIILLTTIFSFLTILKTRYVLTISRNIDKGNIKITEDEVVSLNNLIEYRDSRKHISFKFKNYKKIVFANKDEYYDTKIGDKFYLIFVKGETEPIKVYNLKNSILDSQLRKDK